MFWGSVLLCRLLFHLTCRKRGQRTVHCSYTKRLLSGCDRASISFSFGTRPHCCWKLITPILKFAPHLFFPPLCVVWHVLPPLFCFLILPTTQWVMANHLSPAFPRAHTPAPSSLSSPSLPSAGSWWLLVKCTVFTASIELHNGTFLWEEGT